VKRRLDTKGDMESNRRFCLLDRHISK